MATPLASFPDAKLLALFGVGAVVMRGAGCTLNDLIDREIDKKVARTKDRPLASGKLNVEQAVALLAAQMSTGLAILLSLNSYSVVVGCGAVVVLSLYPWMKRVTNWPQAVLGLAFNWGALLGWSAVQGHCNWSVVVPLYLAGIAWTLHYDTIYAHQDKTDDAVAGVRSSALRLGSSTRPALALFSSVAAANLALAGYMAAQPWPFFAATALGAAHLAWQVGTVDLDNPADCMAKFKSNRNFGAIIAGGALLGHCI